ncbi:hypothetical protein DJ523_04830 [Sulfolobus sp. E5]|nr:hypothetical protein DJ523_04830 [Sulfolobus sp. E5]
MGNKIPLIDVEVECPKYNSWMRIKGLIDSGSRYSLLSEERIKNCFHSSSFLDVVSINGLWRERYKAKIKILENVINISVVSFDMNSINLPIIPEMILGRESVLDKVVMTFYKNNYFSIYID